ncbi:DUF4142 domain-containing protein [Pedobacter steynii]|uniref:DUF4142 domain-containing protein n=1 Tax=Pedobacter steynii TaxID=430522 RepID=A0A1D7QP88_9SPHI|nr:DUF4142 domain-containing protein [Pedobacter steynii]AOM80490.1 hypothetical protein BFS30_27025 [Pedobacter steynii]
MKTKHLTVIFSLVVLAFAACRNTDKINAGATDSSIEQSMTDTTAINRGADPAAFIKEAAIAGIMEIELGKVAMEKATNAKIKKFGEKMVKDHSNIAADLKTLADSKKITLPATLPSADQQHIEEMKKLSGKAFDKHYMEMMEKDHVKALDLFKSAAVSGDVKIRNFASKTLRVVERHFKLAGEINAGTTY